jgi:sulfide:quinone oxidoreductase
MAQPRILIVGGGAAGLTAASQLRRSRPELSITLLEPSENHDYQPGWTLVGAGVFSLEETRRREAELIPAGVEWIREAAAGFDPKGAPEPGEAEGGAAERTAAEHLDPR